MNTTINLSVADVAAREGVAERTVRAWCAEYLLSNRPMPKGMIASRRGRKDFVILVEVVRPEEA